MTGGVLTTADFDFQHHFRVGARQDLIWGGGYRLREDKVTSSASIFGRRQYRDNLLNAFVQNDITLVRSRLVLTVGSKVEHNSYTGVEVQPGARLAWMPSDAQTIWTAVSRAVRQPSLQELDLRYETPPSQVGIPTSLLLQGNPNSQSELVTAYEAGVRRQLSRRLSLDLATFVNDYDRLQQWETLPPYVSTRGVPRLVVPLSQYNSLRGRTAGVETSVAWEVTSRWRLTANHTWTSGSFSCRQMCAPSGNEGPFRAPHNAGTVRSSLDLGRRWTLDASVTGVSRTTWAAAGYVRVDFRLAYKVGEWAEVSAGVKDLARRHLEFSAADDYLMSSYVRPSAYVKLTRIF